MKREIKIGQDYWANINGQVVKVEVVRKVRTFWGGVKYDVVFSKYGGELYSKLLSPHLIYKEYKNGKFFDN